MKHKVFRQASELSETAQRAFLIKTSQLVFTGIILSIIISLLLMVSQSFWQAEISVPKFLIFASSSFLLTFIARSFCFSMEDKILQLFSFFSFIGLQSLCMVGAMKAVECYCGVYAIILFIIPILGISLRCFKSIKHLSYNKDLLKRFNHRQFGSLALFLLSSSWFLNSN